MKKIIISTHIPKTAGTSFRHVLYEAFGKEKILHDYEDDPVNPISRYSIDPDYYNRNKILSLGKYLIVHGHFAPSKYQHVENACRLTFLRHPIDNIISIYCFWMIWDGLEHHTLNYVRDNNLSVVEFASLPKIRWLYSKTYFGDCNLRHFDFIGRFHHYKEDLVKLSYILETELKQTIFKNITGQNNIKIEREKQRISMNARINEKLRNLLSDDISFFYKYTKK